MAPNQSKLNSRPNVAMAVMRHIEGIIPLERLPKKDLKKGEYVVIKCCSIPGDNNSPTYNLPILYFKSGSPREWLDTMKNLKKTIMGQNVMAGPSKYAMACWLLERDALTFFNLKATAHGTKTNANFDECLQDVTEHVFLFQVAWQQKCCIRHFLRKPHDMPIRVFMAKLLEQNSQLTEYPKINRVAPDKISDNEIKEMLKFMVCHQ